MRMLLISNSTQHGRGYLDHCRQAIAEFLGPRRRVLFVPYAVRDWDAYTLTVRSRLADLKVRGIHETPPDRALDWAEAIFIGGGNTFRLLNDLYRNRLLDPIRQQIQQGVPYLGSSAGTNVACPTIMTTNDMPIVYPPSFEALGLIPFQINPHYLDADPSSRHQGETREQRINEFHEMNTVPVLGLREGSWLIREDGLLQLKGENAARLFEAGRTPREFPPGSDLSSLLQLGSRTS